MARESGAARHTNPAHGTASNAQNAARNKKSLSARDMALDILTACQRQDAWVDAALNARLQKETLSASDAALCSRLVYGVTQRRMTLDFYLDALCTQKVTHLQRPLTDILRLGAYQILFLDRVPDSAAVNEAVKQTVRVGRKNASGMVNAVLRRLSREKASLPALPDADTVTALSVRYSHPRWLVSRMLEILGAAETERFLDANNQIPPVTLQVNPLRTTRDALLAELAATGVTASAHPWAADCVELSGGGALTRLPPFRTGKCYVQDPAAHLVTDIAGIKPGDSVLDVCAAPGGKTFGAAFAVGTAGRVLSCDVNANKLKRITDGAKRLGLDTIIRTAQADGRVFNAAWEGHFDAVLVDVPCSGLGIIRKKPDIRYRDPAPLDALPALQYAILDNASRYVCPGGTLLYSTCTVLPDENERVTQRFLAEHDAFCVTPFDVPAFGRTDGQVTLWTQRNRSDGFYLCRMARL